MNFQILHDNFKKFKFTLRFLKYSITCECIILKNTRTKLILVQTILMYTEVY